MKGLITFTLFGDIPLYNIGALRNVQIWNESPFDVTCRFYVGKSVPEGVKLDLKRLGAQIVEVDAPEDQEACFWRFDAFQEVGYEYYMSRDVDSRPYEREFQAIREWLGSDKQFHIIRDHPFHGVPILAGLFGVKSGMRFGVAQQLPAKIPSDFYLTVNKVWYADNFISNDFYQIDQWWLRINCYPYLHNEIIAHDEFFGFERKVYRSLLPPREGNMFCGEGFTEDDEPRHPEHRDMLDYWPRRVI
jgi:hypothetical protein